MELGNLRRTVLQVHERKGRRRQVLVGVETSDGGDISDVGNLNHRILLTVVVDKLVGRKWRKRVSRKITVAVLIIASILVSSIVPMLLQFFRHWRKGDSLWKIWERIDETSLLCGAMEEGAAFTELAITSLGPVFTLDCFVVRVDSSEGSFTEILWQRIIWLSQIILSVGELAVLSEWALLTLEIVLAQLSFVFLFERIELTLVSVEILVVRLLGQVTHHFSWGIIEISWPSICVETLGFIARLFAR